jgi:hypothetical protein
MSWLLAYGSSNHLKFLKEPEGALVHVAWPNPEALSQSGAATSDGRAIAASSSANAVAETSAGKAACVLAKRCDACAAARQNESADQIATRDGER